MIEKARWNFSFIRGFIIYWKFCSTWASYIRWRESIFSWGWFNNAYGFSQLDYMLILNIFRTDSTIQTYCENFSLPPPTRQVDLIGPFSAIFSIFCPFWTIFRVENHLNARNWWIPSLVTVFIRFYYVVATFYPKKYTK